MIITFEEVTTIPAAVALKLSPAQVLARSNNLELIHHDPDVWVGTTALQFKVGETVEIVGDLPKGILPVYDQKYGLMSDTEIEELNFSDSPAVPIKKTKKTKTD